MKAFLCLSAVLAAASADLGFHACRLKVPSFCRHGDFNQTLLQLTPAAGVWAVSRGLWVISAECGGVPLEVVSQSSSTPRVILRSSKAVVGDNASASVESVETLVSHSKNDCERDVSVSIVRSRENVRVQVDLETDFV